MLGSETRHLGADCHDRAETYLQGTNFHLSLIVVMMHLNLRFCSTKLGELFGYSPAFSLASLPI